MIETLLGGVVGGLLRLAPEVLNVFKHKRDLDHEYRMMQVEVEIATKKLEFGMRQTEAEIDAKQFETMAMALREQGMTARAAGKLVAAISALVRPIITYWFVGLYSLVKIVGMAMAIDQGGEWKEVLIKSWNQDDMAILFMIISFWFVGRAIDKRNSSSR